MFYNILHYIICLIMSNLKDLNKVVSARCREELIRLGIKGVDFVAKTGLSKQTFSAVFNGVTSAPSGFISAFCTHYPADVSYIITGVHASSASDTTADNGENSKAGDELSAILKARYDYNEKEKRRLEEYMSSAIQRAKSYYNEKGIGHQDEYLSSPIRELTKSDYIELEILYLRELMKSREREIADKERLINLMMEMNKGTRE